MANIDISKKLMEASRTITALTGALAEVKESKEKLQMENIQLTLRLRASERSKRSLSLAEEMYKKNLISKGNIIAEAEKIMDYSDESFNILKETVASKITEIDKEAFSIEGSGVTIKEAYDRGSESKKMISATINSVK
jgi:regulator of replication initiation timing